MTDSSRNHGFGVPNPQDNGNQPLQSRRDTHPDTVDFEAPKTTERNYSNPFIQQGSGYAAAQPGYQTQQDQWGRQPDNGFGSAVPHQAPASTGTANGGKMVLVAVLILAVLLVIAALGYVFFFKDSASRNQAQPPLTTGAPAAAESAEEAASAQSTQTSEEKTTSAKPARPEYPELPYGAQPVNEAALNNEPGGDFNSVYRGSTVTSEPFATVVRDEYVKHYLDTKELNATIEAYSPVTKVTYTMNCSDNGKFVTCTGGNNAIVYIV